MTTARPPAPVEVLLAAQPTVGHVTGLLTIARHLRAMGAAVRFALPWKRLPRLPFPLPAMLRTALALPLEVDAAGLEFVPLPADPRLLLYATVMPRTSGAQELRLAARMMTTGVCEGVRCLEAELQRRPADLIVGDFGYLAAGLAAERCAKPFVAFFHSGLPFPRDGRYPFEGGALLSRLVDARLAEIRQKLGLPARGPGFFDAPFSPDLNLLATTPALEGDPLDHGPRTEWVGPCVDGRVEREGEAFPLHRLRADATKVYLSLGTVFNGHPERFRTVLRGLEGPGVQVVVSAGASFEALAPLANEDVLLFRSVPQLAVLRAVDFVVSHGGNNTVNEALLAGRPLLVMPIGGEQMANARRVERLNAGLVLDHRGLTPETVRAALTRLRTTPAFAESAQRIAAAAPGPGAAGAARRMLDLARARASR